MRSFVLSRRFFLPFFLLLIVYAGYTGWTFGELYWRDFQARGLPTTVFIRWLWLNTAGDILGYNILLSLLFGMVYWSHYYSGKQGKQFTPFAARQVVSIGIIAIAGFVYVSFLSPVSTAKSQTMLSNVIFARSYSEFKELMGKQETVDYRNEKAMDLWELYRLKRTQSLQKEEPESPRLLQTRLQDKRWKIEFEINKKYVFPLTIILFWIMGILMGYSFCKIHRIFPLLIAFLILPAAWYYFQHGSEIAISRGRTGVISGLFRTDIILAAILLIWYFLLLKFRVIGKKPAQAIVE